MKINNINKFTQAISKPSKIVSKPIESSVNKIDSKRLLCTGAAAISGMYIANKSVNENNSNYQSIKKLNLSDEIIYKILNSKNEYGNKIFDKNAIKILSEVSELEDNTFYKSIIDNAEYINKLEKHIEPSFEGEVYRYEMSADTPKGSVSGKMVYLKDKGCTVYNGNNYNEDGIPVLLENVVDNTYFSQKKKIYFGEEDRFVWDKFEKLITTEKRDASGNLVYTKTTALSDNDLIDSRFERKYSTVNNKVISDTSVVDYKNDIRIKSEEEKKEVYLDDNEKATRHDIQTSVRKYRNPVTGRIETLKMEKSEVPGLFNTTIIDDLGNIRKECNAYKDSLGNICIEKNLESFDGTTTKYTYKSSDDEKNVKMFYQIKDKNGKILTTVDRTFNRVSPTLAYSSINGHSYIIETKNDSINVTDNFTKETTKILKDDIYYSDDDKEHSELIDKLSGDMLLDMYNRNYSYIYLDDLNKSIVDERAKTIETHEDLFTFAHEQGHSKDLISPKDSDYDSSKVMDSHQNRIINNPYFKKVFKSERRQFRENFPELEKKYVAYFTNSLSRGSMETVAEANALFSTGMPPKTGDVARVYYLQKYFPKTLAVASVLLNPNSNIYLANK